MTEFMRTKIRLNDHTIVEIDTNTSTLYLKSDLKGIAISTVRAMVQLLSEEGVPVTVMPIYKRTPDLAARVMTQKPWDWSPESHLLLEHSLVERVQT